VAEGFGYPFNLAKSWRGNYPCSGWLGLVCDNSSDVAIIFMHHYELSGTISPAIGDLIGLQKIVLANNNLIGEIPESLTKLPKLELLDVRNNKLTGQLPKFKPSVRVLADGNTVNGENSHKVLLLMDAYDAGSQIDALLMLK
jgi:hypothetical protein